MNFVQPLSLIIGVGLMVMLFSGACSGNDPAKSEDTIEFTDPPFSGTAYIDPDIVTSSDSTTFQEVLYQGQEFRTMYDRRVGDWTEVEAYVFEAEFNDGMSAQIQVNPEFGSPDSASKEAQKYGSIIGKLPVVLRKNVETVSIHKGTEPFGGGNRDLLIHTGQAKNYEEDGFLEEVLVHEASHTSLDSDHSSSSRWLAAQEADKNFISTYARDNSEREDIAESFSAFLAIRYRAGRISESLADTIKKAIPNRIDYFDSQSFEMPPINEQ